ncbi:hypothetical protein [Paenibacillus sp. Leaf72]|uniref:hypothetical protein n=1 Tax=Paenibacillus sp. Leaf72 TaxID=1736234 RepID=UPI0012DD45F2|nr:hypothetical protein [Paenibacillus sp. Leaf72]
MNEHAELTATGVIAEEHQDQAARVSGEQEPIELQELNEEGAVIRTLFSGVLKTMVIQRVRNVFTFRLEALSHSSRMDVKGVSRTFQNKEMAFSEAIEKLLAPYPGSDYIDGTFQKAKLNQLFIQYQETNWAFLKRLASQAGAVLIPEVTASAPKIWIGVPEGKVTELPDMPYRIKRHISAYYGAHRDTESTLSEASFTTYTIETPRYMTIGESVIFQGKELVVEKAIGEMQQGILSYTYILTPFSGIRQNKILPKTLSGVSFNGKVIEVQGEQVKVHFELDEKQEKSEACWLPYATPYAAEGNSGLYAMPELGDSVQVHIGSRLENDAVVRHSMRQNGQASAKHTDPSVKYWGSPAGKEMKLGTTDLVMTGKENQLTIKLDEQGGITIDSDSSIEVEAGGGLFLGAGTIKGTAAEAIHLVCGSSSMVMDGETDVKAADLRVEGIIKLPVFVEDLPLIPEPPLMSAVAPPEPDAAPQAKPEPEAEAPKKKGLFDKLLDGVQTALSVVGMIPVVGAVANVANASISAARGNYTGAGLALAASIPFGGWSAPKQNGQSGNGQGSSALQNLFQLLLENMPGLLGERLGKVFTTARSLASNVDWQEVLENLKREMIKQENQTVISGVMPQQDLDYVGNSSSEKDGVTIDEYYQEALKYYAYQKENNPFFTMMSNSNIVFKMDAINQLVDAGQLSTESDEYKKLVADIYFNGFGTSELAATNYLYMIENLNPVLPGRVGSGRGGAGRGTAPGIGNTGAAGGKTGTSGASGNGKNGTTKGGPGVNQPIMDADDTAHYNGASSTRNKTTGNEGNGNNSTGGGTSNTLGVVQSRINVAAGRTRFTPLRPKTGEPVSAGWDHVVEGHFNVPLANSRSVFSLSPNEVKTILQSPTVVKSPVTAIPGGQYVRVVNVGKVVGHTALKFGGKETTWIKIFTDKAGNLISTYPVPAP